MKNNNENERLPYEHDKAVKKHLHDVRKQIFKNMIKAYQGWIYWFFLRKIKGYGNTAIILIPSTNKNVSYLALRYLDSMLSSRGYDNAIVLTVDPIVSKAADLFSDRILSIRCVTRKRAEALMQLYCLYEFDKCFICASLDEPYGRKGVSIVGLKGLTIDEVFAIGVYRIYPFVKLEPPLYCGDDMEVKEFINCLQ